MKKLKPVALGSITRFFVRWPKNASQNPAFRGRTMATSLLCRTTAVAAGDQQEGVLKGLAWRHGAEESMLGVSEQAA